MTEFQLAPGAETGLVLILWAIFLLVGLAFSLFLVDLFKAIWNYRRPYSTAEDWRRHIHYTQTRYKK